MWVINHTSRGRNKSENKNTASHGPIMTNHSHTACCCKGELAPVRKRSPGAHCCARARRCGGQGFQSGRCGVVSDPAQGASAVAKCGAVRRSAAGGRQDRLQRPHEHDVHAGARGAVAGDVQVGGGTLCRCHPRLYPQVVKPLTDNFSWSTFSFSFPAKG